MPLPLSKPQALKCINWLKSNFDAQLKAAVKGTPFSVDTLCGIACQETANVWYTWIGKKSPEEILSLCVFDASGDFPGTQRSAFPKNTAAFRTKYGDGLANMLIAEANRSRKARSLPARDWVYKGYGIFQYDLQHILTDEDFFVNKKWQSMDVCLEKVMLELNRKWEQQKNIFKTIRSYNGSGPRAEEYANNVTIFINYSNDVIA